MKRILMFIALTVALISPAVAQRCISSSYNPGGPTSTDLCKNQYCYCSFQENSDYWTLYIDPVGNETGYIVEYKYDIVYCCGTPTTIGSWTPVTWPIPIGSGSGGMPTNIQIRIITGAGTPPGGSFGYCDIDLGGGLYGNIYNVGSCP